MRFPCPACGKQVSDFLSRWTTTNGATADDGTFAARGFLGDYEITVTSGERTQSTTTTLPTDGASVTITLR